MLAALSPSGAHGQEKESDTKSNVANPSPNAITVATPTIGPNQEDQQPGESQTNPQQQSKGWPPRRDAFWSNWALVAITLIAAIIAIWTLRLLLRQTVATEATVRTMQDTAERELRAYVSPVSMNRFVENGVAYFKITYENSGQTPAHGCAQWVAEHIVPLTKDTKIPEANNTADKSVFVLAPKGTMEVIQPAAEIPPEIVVSIQKKFYAIYLYGEISYLDAFGKRRHTRFRCMCHGDGFAVGRFAPCEDGNYAD
jgi:hypothetical protein